jgi:putative transcriptional regulator
MPLESRFTQNLYLPWDNLKTVMKMRDGPNEILIDALRVLHKAGFSISEVESGEYCLEIVAKKGKVRLLIKTSENVDTERREPAEDLKSLASAYSASPIIISPKNRNEAIEEGALYERFRVNVVSPDTFREATLNGKLPSIYSKRGGLYFRINGRYLRRLREERGLSLGDLAKRIGVSRKAVYDYENGTMGATLETVARLEEALDAGITAGIDIFDWQCTEDMSNRSPSGPVARQIHGKLKELGCKAISFKFAPVDVHARNVGVSFLANDRSQEERELDRRVETAIELGKLLDVEPVLVTGDRRPRDVDITVVRMDEVRKLESLKDLERLIRSDNISC